MKNQGYRYGEKGGAIVWIFVLISLFAALTYVGSRNTRTGLSNLDNEQSGLAATEIISFGQSVREGVRRLRIKGCADTAFRFSHGRSGNAYDNPNAPADNSCDIFHPNGAALTYLSPVSAWLALGQGHEARYGQWIITGAVHVRGIGIDGTAGSTCNTGNECKDLVLALPFLTRNVCQAINRKLNFSDSDGTPPRDADVSIAAASIPLFQGVYPNAGAEIGTGSNPANSFSGKIAGCYEGGTTPGAGTYHFFQVLHAR